MCRKRYRHSAAVLLAEMLLLLLALPEAVVEVDALPADRSGLAHRQLRTGGYLLSGRYFMILGLISRMKEAIASTTGLACGSWTQERGICALNRATPVIAKSTCSGSRCKPAISSGPGRKAPEMSIVVIIATPEKAPDTPAYGYSFLSLLARKKNKVKTAT